MGNRALRKQLGELIGTFREGPKMATFRYLRANKLRNLIEAASLEVGNVIHDCSGWNHRISKIEPMWRSRWPRRGLYLHGFDILFEDGGCRCECSSYVEPARTVKDIELFWKSWITYHNENSEWSEGEYYQEILRRIENGISICDEHGIELPELRSLRYKSTDMPVSP